MNFLKDLDVFGQPVRLFVRGKQLHKTSTGGVFTIIIFVIILLLLVRSLFGLVNRFTITIEEKTEYDMTPPLLDLNSDNFMFSIGLQDQTMTLNNSLFSYSAMQITMIKANRQMTTTKLPINLGPCLEADYGGLADFEENDLSQTLCAKNNSYPIQGAVGNNISQFLQISIQKCINGTNPNITCASQQTIDNYFNSNQKVEVVLYFINRVVNPFSLDTPYLKFIDSQIWTLSPLGSLARSTDIYLRHSELSSYDDLSGLGSPTQYNSMTFAQDRTDNTYIPSPSSTTYADISLKSGNYKMSYIRSYGTFLQVLSFIGGIWNLLYLCLGFVAAKINNHIYNVEMGNIMYDFDARECTTQRYERNKTLNLVTVADDKNQNSNNNISPGVFEKFMQMTIMRSQLNYSIGDYLRNLFYCFKSKLTIKKDKLFNMANDKISKNMDIGWIMKKIQDIEKLKDILLTTEQQGIFNFVPPKIISTIDSKNNRHLDKNKQIEEDDEEYMENALVDLCQDPNEYYKHFDMYMELKKNPDSIVNQNLIASLHPEIVSIFEEIEKEKKPVEGNINNDNTNSNNNTNMGILQNTNQSGMIVPLHESSEITSKGMNQDGSDVKLEKEKLLANTAMSTNFKPSHQWDIELATTIPKGETDIKPKLKKGKILPALTEIKKHNKNDEFHEGSGITGIGDNTNEG